MSGAIVALKIMTSLFKTTCRNRQIKAGEESIGGGLWEIIRKESETADCMKKDLRWSQRAVCGRQ